MLMASQLTFTDEAVQLCPFSAYDQLREEQPVYLDPVSGHYVLTRYEDIRKVLLNHAAFSNRTGFLGDRWAPEAMKLFEARGWLPMDTLVSADPPEHRRYRTLVDKAFSATKVSTLEPRIEQIINELIDAFPDSGEIDFLQAFAIPLPVIVIAEQLGLSRADQDRFKAWSDCAVETTDPTITPERQVELAHTWLEMQAYMAVQVERVRAEPNETLISHLANLEVDGESLSMRELQSLLMHILVGGFETTTTTLASGVKVLIEQPELAEELHNDPGRAQTLGEEVLRTATPLQTLFRRTLQDVTVSGVDIPANAIVEVRFGAANLDPRQFACPANVDVHRANATSHLAFGAGIHVCVGNQLARAELRLAFQALTRRLKNFRFSRGDDSLVPMTGYTPYGSRTLWMRFDRR